MALAVRAEEVACIGEHIGLFEWLAWASLTQTRILLLIGREIIDVVDLVGVGLVVLPSDAPIHRVVGCSFKTGIAYSAVDPITGAIDLNHYMIGTLLSNEIDSVASVAVSDVVVPLPLPVALAIDFREFVCNAALVVGWHVRLTQAMGDCGIDCMCFFADLPRDPRHFFISGGSCMIISL